MKKSLIIFLFLSCIINLQAQKLFYSNALHGGSTGGGFFFGPFGFTQTSSLLIPPNSSIEKAFLITTRNKMPADIIVSLNGIPYSFNSNSAITQNFISMKQSNCIWNNSTINAIDITNDIDSSISIYKLIVPAVRGVCKDGSYPSFYLYIVYKNSSLPKTSCNLFVNTQDVSGIVAYNLKGFMPINNNLPVSLGVCGYEFCDTITDGSYIDVNNSTIGLLGGVESNSGLSCSGAYANFSYYNDSLFGLLNDTSDSLMNGTDALADIKSYINNLDTSLNVTFRYQTLSYIEGKQTNPVSLLTLTYTTPCDTFTTKLNADTAICAGDSIQLQASGGIKYQWQPAYGLSCTTCANPIASPDSSVTYTVRISNNDSCSKVFPVQVKVNKIKPKITIVPSRCGDSNGYVKFETSNITQYELGNLSNTNGEFKHLHSGAYPVTLTDNIGCTWQDTIKVGFQNTAYAGFGIFPKDSGRVPLHIYTNNASQHTNKYIWAVNGDSLYTSTISYTFDKAGHYILTLIACHNSYPCCDTMSKEIVVTPLSLDSVPNVFTPNGDGINDKFTIKLNGVERGKISIFNRWGILLYHTYMQEANAQHNLKLQWNGKTEKNKDCSAGTYYYVINYIPFEEGEKTVKGNVTLLR